MDILNKPDFCLLLSEEEAKTLQLILGMVGGNSKRRKLVKSILNALNSNLSAPDYFYSDVTIGGNLIMNDKVNPSTDKFTNIYGNSLHLNPCAEYVAITQKESQ